MNNTLKRARFVHLFAALTVAAFARGIQFVVTSGRRTAEEQHQLFLEGKSKNDGIKKISQHQLDLARDIVIINEKGEPIWDRTPDYDNLGEIWEGLGGRWGGLWGTLIDIFHFEI
jgi:peptidoglycan L-alanyl-D-glutamate endopeptidase CwlK